MRLFFLPPWLERRKQARARLYRGMGKVQEYRTISLLPVPKIFIHPLTEIPQAIRLEMQKRPLVRTDHPQLVAKEEYCRLGVAIHRL